MDLTTKDKDQPVFAHIQHLVEDEHRLYEQGEKSPLEDADRQRLANLQVELDQYWDLLRQRRALRGVGQIPSQAQVRSAQMVENYEQ